jgi:MoxR-like ATPase
VALTAATRTNNELTLGASPRASLHLLRAAKAHAALHGREFVLPDDVRRLTGPVLAHRLLPSASAAMHGRSVTDILEAVVSAVPVPQS